MRSDNYFVGGTGLWPVLSGLSPETVDDFTFVFAFRLPPSLAATTNFGETPNLTGGTPVPPRIGSTNFGKRKPISGEPSKSKISFLEIIKMTFASRASDSTKVCAALLSSLLLVTAGCGRDEIKVYDVPKPRAAA